ncbi:hydroxyethylthiazole kinase, partial [Anaerostipes sp.]|uniref:hydroxyethylthiazole kinase n=1 Tax=Anaerostipes sp. TaxID=1872530 RepID=UPI003FEE26AB
MMKNPEYRKIFQKKEKHPGMVHCMTNYVTVNDVANIILACGASPIMADDPKEVQEITALTTDLVLNMGTLNERKLEAMLLAGKKANELGHPVILDPVGVGASSFRKEAVKKLFEEIDFSVIRGNLSEIKAIFQGNAAEMGVDAA